MPALSSNVSPDPGQTARARLVPSPRVACRGGDLRQVLDSSQPERLEELTSCSVQQGLSDKFRAAGNSHESSFDERPKDLATGNAPDRLQFRAQHGLSVGDDGQRLQSCLGQPMMLALPLQSFDQRPELWQRENTQTTRHALDPEASPLGCVGPIERDHGAVEIMLLAVRPAEQFKDPAVAQRSIRSKQKGLESLQQGQMSARKLIGRSSTILLCSGLVMPPIPRVGSIIRGSGARLLVPASRRWFRGRLAHARHSVA